MGHGNDSAFDLSEIFSIRNSHPGMHRILCKALGEYSQKVNWLPLGQELDQRDLKRMLDRQKIAVLLLNGDGRGLRLVGALLGRLIVLQCAVVICVDRFEVANGRPSDKQRAGQRMLRLKQAAIYFVSSHYLVYSTHSFEEVQRSEIHWRPPQATTYETFRWCNGDYVPA